jgi:DNA topoisomerase-1
MDYGFTAGIEQKFDHIAEGKIEWAKVIDQFYKPFHKDVEKTLAEADRASGERILGKDPETGRTILVRMSRLGKPVVQIGTGDELEEGEKPKYANLKPGTTLETVNFVEALASFALPRTLGELEGAEITVNAGRFGPYVKIGDMFVSIPRTEDPFEIGLDRAIELIKAKQEADKPFAHYKDQPVTKGKGRFGPFLKWTDLYVNVPARINFDSISEKQAIELIEAKIEKEANRYIQLWPEEKLSIENGRWGPFIRFGKKPINLPKKDGAKMTVDQARTLSLEDVKAIVEQEMPGAFKKKTAAKKAAAKKPAAKKKPTKK